MESFAYYLPAIVIPILGFLWAIWDSRRRDRKENDKDRIERLEKELASACAERDQYMREKYDLMERLLGGDNKEVYGYQGQ